MKLELTWQQTILLIIVFGIVGALVYVDKLHGDTLAALAMGILLPSPLRSKSTDPKVLTPSKRPPPLQS